MAALWSRPSTPRADRTDATPRAARYWVERSGDDRSLAITEDGYAGLKDALAIGRADLDRAGGG